MRHRSVKPAMSVETTSYITLTATSVIRLNLPSQRIRTMCSVISIMTVNRAIQRQYGDRRHSITQQLGFLSPVPIKP
jgi:hypothetical protein